MSALVSKCATCMVLHSSMPSCMEMVVFTSRWSPTLVAWTVRPAPPIIGILMVAPFVNTKVKYLKNSRTKYPLPI